MENTSEQLFFKIIEENQNRIQRICSVYTSNEEDQKDLTQEVLLNIWKSLPSYRGGAPINTWIYRIILNVCLRANYLKNKNRHISIEAIKFEKISSGRKSKNELTQKLRQCIHQLEDSDKSIILLFLEELPYEEIATIIGISENYVAVKIKRIKEKLFFCLKGQE